MSGQYHFGKAGSMVRPFVGLGYYQSNSNNESTASTGPYAGKRIGMSTPKGAIATVGMDLNFTPNVFARADARYMDGGANIAVDGVKSGRANLDPVVLGVGVGVGGRF